jgi:perosamine synthetase
MLAAGIGPGDEVITTPFSFRRQRQLHSVRRGHAGLRRHQSKTLNMDVAKAAAAITPKTKAIVAVECFGHPGGMIELEQLARRAELILIEDCCEGFGGRVGRGPRDRVPSAASARPASSRFIPTSRSPPAKGA